MRIGLLSDTHIPEAAEALPPKVMEAFQGVSLILHAGDIYSPSVLDELERIAPVLAARGDDDWGDALTDKRVKEKHTLELEEQALWLVHKRPDYFNSLWWVTPLQQNKLSTGHKKYDIPNIVVFGHEHHAVVERVSDILFINPGSPTFPGYRRTPGTVGILDINSGEAEACILQL